MRNYEGVGLVWASHDGRKMDVSCDIRRSVEQPHLGAGSVESHYAPLRRCTLSLVC